MTRPEKAKQLFMSGYNCSQAVVGAFIDDFAIDFDTAMKLSSSFGGGMGRMREVCGAVSGAFMIAGLKCGYCDPCDKAAKSAHYALIQKIAADFKQQNGSIICRELLEGVGCNGKCQGSVPEDRTAAYYKKRPCAELVYIAAKIVEDEIYG
mgnify:FL=1